MAEATIPVDLFNPGQVFACIGLVEAADVLLGNARGRFSWEEDAYFTLSADGTDDPVGEVLSFIETAELVALRPLGSELENGKGIKTRDFSPEGTFPTAIPDKKARLIARLEAKNGGSLDLSYWGEIPGQSRAKFWGGNRTAPGVCAQAQQYVKGAPKEDPFSFCAPCGGVFRFDPRGGYLPLDSGFSLNEHKAEMSMMGYPVTEILAAIGMTYARPRAEHKVSYTYRVLGNTPYLTLPLLRAMIGTSQPVIPGFATRTFQFFVGSPSASSEEYPITDVQEIPEETRT